MRIGRIIMLGCLLASAAWAGGGEEIYIRVQDYSGMAADNREKTFATASLILGRAGVAVVWLDCSPGSAQPMPGRCRQPLTSTDLVLRLAPERMAARMAATGAVRDACLGYALVPNSGLGTLAAVFVDKARDVAMKAAVRQSAVLGHALAHEIGHLLIGSSEHSRQGLMKAVWSRPELLRAVGYPMSFSAEEQRLIVWKVRQRLARVGPTEMPLEPDAEALRLRPADLDSSVVKFRPRLTLRVYNYAGVTDKVLRRTAHEVARILNEIGIESRWLDCPTSPEHMATNRVCAGPAGPSHLILNLLPHSMSKRYGFRSDVFGFALPARGGRPGTRISLFYARVLDLAYHGATGLDFEPAQVVILGHMTAHEIGHLLLGPASHGSSGVMSFPWGKRELTDMVRGRLKFTAQEQSRVLAELNRRSTACLRGDRERSPN